jgi:hypothetical protein
VSAEYAFRVTGRLTPGILGALDPLHASAATTETTLVGLAVDGAALHGFIARIEALGLELVELRRLPRHPADGGPTSRCPERGCCDEDAGRGAATAVASRNT